MHSNKGKKTHISELSDRDLRRKCQLIRHHALHSSPYSYEERSSSSNVHKTLVQPRADPFTRPQNIPRE